MLVDKICFDSMVIEMANLHKDLGVTNKMISIINKYKLISVQYMYMYTVHLNTTIN